MREIKFRGKQVDNGEWVYGSLLVTNMSGVYILKSVQQAKKKRGGEIEIKDRLEHYEVIPETVGQFTEFTGHGAVELYEGDICETGTRFGAGAITFVDGMFKLNGLSLVTFRGKLTKIGNIHEK